MNQVFLSYSIEDEREAAIIRDHLQRHGLTVWWDAELPVGMNWAAELGRALEKSDSMIVLVSPSAMSSDVVRRELDHAISNENYRNRVFPVIIKPTPPADLPGFFTRLQMFDLTKNRNAKLKTIVAAIKVGGQSTKAILNRPAKSGIRARSLKKVHR